MRQVVVVVVVVVLILVMGVVVRSKARSELVVEPRSPSESKRSDAGSTCYSLTCHPYLVRIYIHMKLTSRAGRAAPERHKRVVSQGSSIALSRGVQSSLTNYLRESMRSG